MNILFLSFYYQPDLSAGSFRNTALVKALLAQLPKGSRVDVITTLPNRYSTFSAAALEYEEADGVSIHRIALPSHQSGMLDQSKAFLSFARQASRLASGKEYDLVYASSSRLMTAALGAWIVQRKKLPLYLDIRDIFVDTIKDVLPRKLAIVMKPVFSLVERWTVRRATKINVVSEGFVPYFRERYGELNLSRFTNGIDEEFLHVQPTDADCSNPANKPPTILYAGNMGEGQGLHTIIPGFAERLVGKANFKLVGAGGRLDQLKQTMDSKPSPNVSINAPVQRSELIAEYQQADVLFLHLNDYDAFKKVLPSKLFEYAAMGKPILAGVSGYAAEFVERYIDNAAVFPPCDVEGAVAALDKLNLQTRPRTAFVNQFSRQNIMNKMASDVISTGAAG